MEIWSLGWSKTGFLSRCGCVSITVWMHLANKMHGENVKWVQHKNATCSFEQILEVIPNKTVVVRPFKLQLIKHPRKTKYTRHHWWSKDEGISGIILWTTTRGHTRGGLPAKTYILQFCVDTRCCLEDLSGATPRKDEERVRALSVRID